MNIPISVDGQRGVIGNDGMVQFGSDSQANVIFYKKTVPDPVRSRQEARPFYVAVDYVRIQHPGEPLNIIDRPVKDDPRVTQRWPQHWQRFLNNQEEVPEGTPLEILFPNFPEIPANLHTQSVHTVEQLANLTAHALQSIGMGAVEWQTMAKKFLDSAKGGREHHRLTKLVEDLHNQNQVLQNQISLMKTQLERVAAAQQGIPNYAIPNAAPTPAQQYNNSLPQQNIYTGPFNDPVTTNDPQLSSFDTPPELQPKLRTTRKG